MSNDKGVPLGVKRFIDYYIDSISQLEILLLMADKQDQSWTAESTSKELRSSTSVTQKQLTYWHTHDFLVKNSSSPISYQYNPKTDDLRSAVAALAIANKTWKSAIIILIYEKPVSKLRDLADAFNLKGDK